MHKVVTVGAAVIGGIAMLGVGVAVGSHVGEQEALIAAANADTPITPQDKLLLSSFVRGAEGFDALMKQASEGKQVGDKITSVAVDMLNIKRLAASESLKNAAGANAEAMLLIGAGITTGDADTTKEGIEAYKQSEDELTKLSADVGVGTGDSGSAADQGEPSPAP